MSSIVATRAAAVLGALLSIVFQSRLDAEDATSAPAYFAQVAQVLGLDDKAALRFSATAELHRWNKGEPAAGLHLVVKYRFRLTYALDGRYIAEMTITNGATPETMIAREIDSYDGAKYFNLNALNQRMLVSTTRDFATIHLAFNPVGLLFDAIPQHETGGQGASDLAFLVQVRNDLPGWEDQHGSGACRQYERKHSGTRPEVLSFILDKKSGLPAEALLTDRGTYPDILAPLSDAYVGSATKPAEKKLNSATIANCQTSYDFELKSVSANGKEQWIPVKATRKKFEFFKAGDTKDEALINKKIAVAGNGGWQFVTERLETRLADPEWINLDEIEFTLNPAMAGQIVNVDPPATSGSSKDGK